MKIVFHLNSMGMGGAERVVSILSSCFADMGHEVLIATEWKSETEYEADNRIKRVHVGPFEDEYKCSFDGGGSIARIKTIIRRHTRLRKFIRECQPDAVISFCNKANFRTAVALKGLKTKLIVSVRNDPDVDYAPYGYMTGVMKKRADGFVFQTENARKWFNIGSGKKTAVISNPLSSRIGAITSPYFKKERWSDENSSKIILALGRIAPQKDYMLLIKAFEKILDDAPEIQLRILGNVEDPDEDRMLKEYIREKNLDDHILISDASDDVPGELSRAYMYVLSSDYEGMPNSLLEAMAAGLHCVSTDCPCGGPRDLIQDKVNGLLVPSGDVPAMAKAMETLMRDPEAGRKMGDNAARVRKTHHPDEVNLRWKTYLEKVMRR